MNILVFHSDVTKLHMFAFSLESRLGVDVKQATTFEQSMGYLFEERQIDLIIIGQSDQAVMLFKYLGSANFKIPLIYLGGVDGSPHPFPELNWIGDVKESEAPQKLIEIIEGHLQNEPAPVDNDFVRINVTVLLKVVPLQGDVYIRLSSVKHVKLYKAGTTFAKHDLDRIWGEKKLNYLYVKRETAPEFVKKFNDQLAIPFSSSQDDLPETLNQIADAQETIHSLTQTIGFTPEVAELTRSSVNATLKAIGSSPNLTSLVFNRLLKRKDYLSSHSLMLAHVSCMLAARMKWPSESTYHKLVLASFLHDITLKDSQHAKANTVADLELWRTKLSTQEFEAVRNHPFAAGDLLNKMSEVPSDVFTIVAQHHESPQGHGFPRSIPPNQIAPLAAVFIVAEEVVDYLFKNKGEADLEVFFKGKSREYSVGTFRKIVKAFTEAKAA